MRSRCRSCATNLQAVGLHLAAVPHSGTALTEPRMADPLRVALWDLTQRDIQESVDCYRDDVDVDTASR